MSSAKKKQVSVDSERKKTRSKQSEKILTPDIIIRTITHQNETLNNIIKKFGQPIQEKYMPDTPSKKAKSRNNKS